MLAATYAVVMGSVALITGWRLLTDRKPMRYRRGAVVPSGGVTGRNDEDAP